MFLYLDEEAEYEHGQAELEHRCAVVCKDSMTVNNGESSSVH